METKRYQSFFDGIDTENRWSQVPSTMEYLCGTEEPGQNSGDILMDIVNVSCPAGSPAADCKDNSKKQEQPMLRLSQNQQFVFPQFNHSLHGHRQEMDSKELSKTVAESMGLYMNAVREADYALSQHGGSTSPGKMYPVCGRPLEDNQCVSTKSPTLKPFNFQQPSATPRDCTAGTPVSSGAILVSSLSCSPQTSSSISSPGGSNNMVSSTTSPPMCFGPACSSVNSPAAQTPCAPTLANIKSRNSATCSPVESSTVGSPPVASPLNVMRSPMSSPQSMSSVRSPPSCNNTCNMRSSVSSPTGGSCTSTASNCNTIRPSISSPAMGATLGGASPQNPSSVGFPVSSPASGLGLVQNDTNSPEATDLTRDPDFKNFEFPKVEMANDGVLVSQMGMVKYIKNEPGTDFRSVCLRNSECNASNTPFITQIKSEPNKNEGCMNQQPYSEPSPSLGIFPMSETNYFSLRKNIDEYSLSGILGPPISSMNGSYESDVFSNNVLSKGVKQEFSDGSYYQENMPTSAIVGVNADGHSFHYQIGGPRTMPFPRHDVRDQSNPLFSIIPQTLMEWSSRPPTSQGFLGQSGIPEGMKSSPLRQPPSTAKVCLVCGDEASGCHYGVVTCGSCKVFFKRAMEGQHNYLCAGRNDCIIDKIRRKNCPACRVQKCREAGMNLGARKSKRPKPRPDTTRSPGVPTALMQPPIISVLELIEPEDVYSGFDNTQPDTMDYLLSSLNHLAGKQMVRLVKWAKVLPGFRSLPIEDQITLIQYSWMCLSSFCLSWRSYKYTNGQMLYFAPDLIFNESRMQQSSMYDLCVGMRQVSQEFVGVQLTRDEFLTMKVLLLLSTVPKEGLKNHAAFKDMRDKYIKELWCSVAKVTSNSGQTRQRFFQLTKILDAMHDLVGDLLEFCFHTFRKSQALKVEFPEMLVEIISDQIPKVESGLTHTIYFHKD